MEELEQARKEVDKTEGKKPMWQNMFKVVQGNGDAQERPGRYFCVWELYSDKKNSILQAVTKKSLKKNNK